MTNKVEDRNFRYCVFCWLERKKKVMLIVTLSGKVFCSECGHIINEGER